MCCLQQQASHEHLENQQQQWSKQASSNPHAVQDMVVQVVLLVFVTLGCCHPVWPCPFALQGSRSLAAQQPSGIAAHSQQQPHMEASPVVAAVRAAASAIFGCQACSSTAQ
jgi:hypothetical protein